MLIGLGLAVPYWMLKASIHAAHQKNPRQDEFRLKDIAKDQLNHRHS